MNALNLKITAKNRDREICCEFDTPPVFKKFGTHLNIFGKQISS